MEIRQMLLDGLRTYCGQDVVDLLEAIGEDAADRIVGDFADEWKAGRLFAGAGDAAQEDAQLRGCCFAMADALMQAARRMILAPMPRDEARALVRLLCMHEGYVALHDAVTMTADDVEKHWSRLHPDQEPIRDVARIEAQM